MNYLSLYQIDAYSYGGESVCNDLYPLTDFIGAADDARQAEELIKEKLDLLDIVLTCDVKVVPCERGYEMVRQSDDHPMFLLEIT